MTPLYLGATVLRAATIPSTGSKARKPPPTLQIVIAVIVSNRNQNHLSFCSNNDHT